MFVGTLDPTTTRVGWTPIVGINDADTGDALDLTGSRIVCEVRDRQSQVIVLSASTDNAKIAILDVGVFQINFTKADTQNLRADTYDVGVTITTANGGELQPILAALPVFDGIVTI